MIDSNINYLLISIYIASGHLQPSITSIPSLYFACIIHFINHHHLCYSLSKLDGLYFRLDIFDWNIYSSFTRCFKTWILVDSTCVPNKASSIVALCYYFVHFPSDFQLDNGYNCSYDFTTKC